MSDTLFLKLSTAKLATFHMPVTRLHQQQLNFKMGVLTVMLLALASNVNTASTECINNKQFYPIKFGSSAAGEQITCMYIVQSNQDLDSSANDKEDWIAVGGHSTSQDITGSSSVQRAFMSLFQYVGGLKWSFYESTGIPGFTSISACKFANFGLDVVFVTSQPMHVFVFDTQTGASKAIYKSKSNNDLINQGLETRLQSAEGLFLSYRWYHKVSNTDYYRQAVLEMNQNTGEILWALETGTNSQQSTVKELIYTGNLDGYQRLYLLGRDANLRNQISSVNPLSLPSSFEKVYSQTSPNYLISHSFIQYLNLCLCGSSSETTPSDGPQLSAWASFSIVSKTTSQITYIRDYKFDHPGQKYCGGVFADGRHMYVLLVSDFLEAGAKFNAWVYQKDIINFSDDHLTKVNLAPGAAQSTPLIHTFLVKQENNMKTFFFGGSIDNQLSSYLFPGSPKRSSFIEKFSLRQNAKFTCLSQSDQDAQKNSFMTQESSVNTFVGTTAGNGIWEDITSSVYQNIIDLNDIKFSSVAQSSSLSLSRSLYFSGTHDVCGSFAHSVAPGSIDNITYYVNQPAKYFQFDAFNFSIGSDACIDVTFTYYALLKSGAALPSFITLDSTNRIFQVRTNDSKLADTYLIEIFGQPTIGEPSSIIWQVQVKNTDEPKFSTPVQNVKMYYDEAKIVQLPQYSQSLTQVYLSISLHQKLYLPSWVDFDATTRQVRFFPNSSASIGIYDFDLILTESVAFRTSTSTFRLYVVDRTFDLTGGDLSEYQTFNISMQVSNDGKVNVFFGAPIANSKNITLDENTIKFYMIGTADAEEFEDEDGNVEFIDPYPYEYEILKFNQTQISLQIKMDNPSQIGLFVDPEIFVVRFTNNRTFFGSKLEIIHNSSMIMQASIPRQVNYESGQYNLARTIGILTLLVTILIFVANFITKLLYEVPFTLSLNLWIILQLQSCLSLSNVYLPTFLLFYLAPQSSLTWQLTHDKTIFQQLFTSQSLKPVNENYDIGNEIRTENFLVNIGDLIIIGFCIVMLWIVTVVMTKACQNRTRLYETMVNLKNIFNITNVFQGIVITYLAIQHLSLLQITKYEADGYPNKVSLIIASIIHSCYVLFVILGVFYTLKNFKKLPTSKFTDFYFGINLSTKLSALYPFIQLFRFQLYAILLTQASSYPMIQVSLFFALSSVMQLYLLLVQPHSPNTIHLVLAVSNETLLLLSCGICFFYTEMATYIDTKIVMGWVFVTIRGLTVLTNGAVIVYEMIVKIRQKKAKRDIENLEQNKVQSQDVSSDVKTLKQNQQDNTMITNDIKQKEKYKGILNESSVIENNDIHRPSSTPMSRKSKFHDNVVFDLDSDSQKQQSHQEPPRFGGQREDTANMPTGFGGQQMNTHGSNRGEQETQIMPIGFPFKQNKKKTNKKKQQHQIKVKDTVKIKTAQGRKLDGFNDEDEEYM